MSGWALAHFRPSRRSMLCGCGASRRSRGHDGLGPARRAGGSAHQRAAAGGGASAYAASFFARRRVQLLPNLSAVSRPLVASEERIVPLMMGLGRDSWVMLALLTEGQLVAEG